MLPHTLALVNGSSLQHSSGLLATSGLCAHKDTSPEIIDKMRFAFNQAMNTSASLDYFKTVGAIVEPLDGDALAQFLITQRELMAAIR